jgi:hypothetical protein
MTIHVNVWLLGKHLWLRLNVPFWLLGIIAAVVWFLLG